MSFIKKATQFYIQQIIPNHVSDEISISVRAVDNCGANGYCTKMSKKHYEIEIDSSLEFEHMMITLAHEVVHVKQYATKELNTMFVGKNIVDVWKGKRYKNVEYEDQPWEWEALLMEENMYIDFLSECYATGLVDLKSINTTKTALFVC